jgi:LPS sulfotransferase NodH
MIKKLQKAVNDPQMALKLLQIRSGIFRGQKQYKHFIILSRSRTGSNLLISMFNSHPSMYAEGEIFSWLNGRSEKQILNRIYASYPGYIKAVGFKIFYYHPQDDESGLTWQLLQNLDDLYVIHLKRRNILRTLLSRKIAGNTDAYRYDLQKSGKNNQKKTCRFSADELQAGFQQTREWEIKFAHLFADKFIIDVYYEDLVCNPTLEFNKIAEMLQIKSHSPRTYLKRQNPEKAIELIENYATLKAKFSDTQWACFFEE